MKKKEFVIPMDYIIGYIKNGYMVVSLSKEEIEEYNKLEDYSSREQFLSNKGYVEAVNYSITDYELDLTDFNQLDYD